MNKDKISQVLKISLLMRERVSLLYHY